MQARALGDPTRHEIFGLIADSSSPIGVAEITAHVGLNHNAVRQHLAKLVEARLVDESTAPSAGPGRPRLLYRVHPAAESRWGVTGPYERLSMLLTEILRSGDTPVEVGRRAGRRQRLGGTDSTDPIGALTDQIATQGFAPTVRVEGSSVDVVLQECPFTSAVLTDPDTVCQLHLGLAQGLAESIGGITVEGLVPRDPRRAQCLLRCQLSAPHSAG